MPKRGWRHFAHEADIGVVGTGATLAEAFEEVATGMIAAIADPATVLAVEKVTIECSATNVEMLLVDWLNALIYEIATREMLFSRFEVTIDEAELKANVWGEKIDVARHEPAAELKGATYTALRVSGTPEGGWSAQCVIDV